MSYDLPEILDPYNMPLTLNCCPSKTFNSIFDKHHKLPNYWKNQCKAMASFNKVVELDVGTF